MWTLGSNRTGKTYHAEKACKLALASMLYGVESFHSNHVIIEFRLSPVPVLALFLCNLGEIIASVTTSRVKLGSLTQLGSYESSMSSRSELKITKYTGCVMEDAR